MVGKCFKCEMQDEGNSVWHDLYFRKNKNKYKITACLGLLLEYRERCGKIWIPGDLFSRVRGSGMN